jgi:hypothetical protein
MDISLTDLEKDGVLQIHDIDLIKLATSNRTGKSVV